MKYIISFANPANNLPALDRQWTDLIRDAINMAPNRNKVFFLAIVIFFYCLFMPRIFSPAAYIKGVDKKLYVYRHIILEMSQRYDVPAALIAGMIKAESNFRPHVVSPVGARGLMQIMPSTARVLKVRNLHDPKENIRGGAMYLSQLLDQFNGNVKLAVAAYNAGPNAVRKHGRVPPYRETQRYVLKVLKYTQEYQDCFML
jgi:soluble lytic murein transglycosylase-like protein